MMVKDSYPRCSRCGKLLGEYLERPPWFITCPRCKTYNRSPKEGEA